MILTIRKGSTGSGAVEKLLIYIIRIHYAYRIERNTFNGSIGTTGGDQTRYH